MAYRLDLPASMKIHKVFHVSLLSPYRSDGRVQPPPPPVVLDNVLEYEVEKIILHRERKNRGRISRQFLVKWLGYGPEQYTWEPERNLTNCREKLEEYLASVGRPQPVV